MSTFSLEPHLRSIDYHCGEAAKSLREVGEIAEWEFRQLNKGENVQYDNEVQQGPSLYHFAITVVLNIREWANIALVNIKEEEPAQETEAAEEVPDPQRSWMPAFVIRIGQWLLESIGISEDPVDEEEPTPIDFPTIVLILQTADLLREYFKENKCGSEKSSLRERLEAILQHFDDYKFTRSRSLSSGSTYQQVKDSVIASIARISAGILDPRLVASLEQDLGKKTAVGTEDAKFIYEKIESIKDQIGLWEHQEACLRWRSRLEGILGTYFGPHNSTHGSFNDLLTEILPSDRIIEVESMVMIAMQRVDKLTGTIINPRERMDITLYFTSLVYAHNDKVGYLRRIREPVMS